MAMAMRDVESLPPASFSSLPDVIHTVIASFLPDDNRRKGNRLRVSMVSHALRESYGGTLTCAAIFARAGRSAAQLAALLQRQKYLKTVILNQLQVIPAYPWPSHGYHLSINKVEHMNALALALNMKGMLPALKRLDWHVKSGDNIQLVRELSTGTVPLLRHLNLLPVPVTDEGLDSLSDILEARARIPGCQKLNPIPTG